MICLAASLALAGCASGSRGGDGAPSSPPGNLSQLPDAEPRVEAIRASGGTSKPYTVLGQSYVPVTDDRAFRESGLASWYGKKFHAQATASGEPYDMYAMTAAHKTLPLPAYAEVTNLRNGRKIVVRINDRGPFVGDRIIDLSYTAAARLDMLLQGTAPVEVRVITPRSGSGSAIPQPLPVAPAVSAPPPVTVVNAPAAKVPGSSAMYIQAGVFADHENARRRVEVLLAAGLELASLDEMSGTRTLHRVRVGPFASIEEFDLNMNRLRELGIHDARLITD